MPSQPTGTRLVSVGSQDGHIYVLNTKTGKVDHKLAVDGSVSSAPLTILGQVYLGTTKGMVYDVFDEDLTGTASINWDFPADGAIAGTPFAAGNGDTTFVASARGTVYAIRPGSNLSAGAEAGTELWKFHPGGPVQSGLAFHDNVLYVGSDDGYLYAIDTTGPALSWKYKTGGAIRSQILVTGGMVYFGSLDNHVYALRA